MNEPGNCYQRLTADGPAAIAVLRVTGPDAEAVLRSCLQLPAVIPAGSYRHVSLQLDDDPVDDILFSLHAAQPHWDARLHLHGSAWIVSRVCEWLRARGFVERDLPAWSQPPFEQAVACALPRVLTLAGVQWLAAQPEGVRATLAAAERAGLEPARRMLRGMLARSAVLECFCTPRRVALIGPPNAGKSTLLNQLTRREASIVSSRPGTTRDWVEAPGEVAGWPVSWLDTAGLREPAEMLEAAGIRRTHERMATTEVLVLVLDLSNPVAWPNPADVPRSPDAVVLNKLDLVAGDWWRPLPVPWRSQAVSCAAASGDGLDRVVGRLAAVLSGDGSYLSGPAAFTTGLVQRVQGILGSETLTVLRAGLQDLRGDGR